VFDAELQGLLTSTQRQQNPNNKIFIQIKDFMILNIIQAEREIGLLKVIKANTEELSGLLFENCK